MFSKKREIWEGRDALVISGLGDYSLRDTLECGQAFRYELIESLEGWTEYMTVIGEELIFVGQRQAGELIFFDITNEVFDSVVVRYFALDVDYGKIREDVTKRCKSEWLARAAHSARGVVILKQDEWEALFSFIVSQNNNIPRIRKIIRELSAAYGVNICLQKCLKKCPLGKISATPCEDLCKNCGSCYSFPKAADVAADPDKMLPSKPGFRYKYLLCAAERVASGETDLSCIAQKKSYAYTVEELKKIKGVGDKVASCAALFGFGNLEAFPIDVWMKRAIDTYFDGHLDPAELGEYAGVAQQYIFHYIRNLEQEEK
ncbi:MAG: DNA glycosylase [Clostridia bacterium]|nr:DNA glycosylase [Clostridia bacterium]